MIYELTCVFEKYDIDGYAGSQLLTEMDYTMIGLIEQYGELDSDLKQIFREQMSPELVELFLVFSERIASYLIAEDDPELFRLGLHALDACMEKTGTRDIFMMLALYYNVYKRHMYMFAEFLGSGEPIGKALQMFLLKDDKAKAIGAMDYIIEHNTLGQAIFKHREVHTT
ncbi:MAG: hypothetical protein FWF88_04710 [Peptococcaceae bacterium]|nr:hypothetical protein [Peptococcaceae bacterium]